MMGLLRKIFSIPGNVAADGMKYDFRSGNIVMSLGTQLNIVTNADQTGHDVDLVSFPIVNRVSTEGSGSRTINLMITPSSKYKEQALKVITYLLSDEIELENSRKGIATTLRTTSGMS